MNLCFMEVYEKNNRYKYPIYKTPKDMLIVDFVSTYPEFAKLKLRAKQVGEQSYSL